LKAIYFSVLKSDGGTEISNRRAEAALLKVGICRLLLHPTPLKTFLSIRGCGWNFHAYYKDKRIESANSPPCLASRAAFGVKLSKQQRSFDY
jgi:hypothetical protein